MKEEKAKQLLQKYVNGEASAAEIKQVEEWYAQLHRAENKVSEERKNLLRAQMLGNIQSAMSEKQAQRHMLSRYPLLKIAAVLFIIVSASLLISRSYRQPISDTAQIVTTTKTGERKKITLNDGSEIILEPSSKISYPSKFNGEIRELELTEGEAFFTIAHDEEHPFQVQLASDLTVKVLGTSFRIKAYGASKNIEVLVATGKVAVQQQEKVLGILTKNQSMRYNKQTLQTSHSSLDTNTTVAIAFNGASLQEVVQRLAYIYNIKIVLTDKTLKSLKTTATFSSAQKPSEILDILCNLHHCRYSASHNNTIFKIHK